MNDKGIAVIGTFDAVEGVRSAVTALHQSGFKDTTIYSPLNSHEIETELEPVESPIGFLAFGGAAAGAGIGLLLTIGTSIQWPLMTGGQPIISLPPFFVISFELTILFGVLATLLGMFWQIHRSKSDPKFYDSRFSVDRFGVHVVCDEDRVVVVKNLLSTAGAEEVRDERF
ncbi:MAG: DUF3341 domain-containing protein [Deltaproteobacteria bacterium]|nr:DUF3341 domain-containing protein [Deltaproteobacteria bacterium]